MIPTIQQGQFGRTVSSARVPAWVTLFDGTAHSGGSNTGWNGYTVRTVFDAAAGTDYPGLPGPCTKVRMILRGGPAVGFSASKVYVAEGATSGDVYDFIGTPVQVTWGGSGSISAAAGANTALSDEITYAFDGTKKIVVAIYFNGATNMYTDVGVLGRDSLVQHYVLGDSATTVDASTGQAATVAFIVGRLDVFG